MVVKLLVVGAGGFLGAIARYGLSVWIHKAVGDKFPLGTLAVNVAGCLVLGGLAALIQERDALSPSARLFWTVGLLGSLTTFSTFGHETLRLLENGDNKLALSNVALNVVLGLLAVALAQTAVKEALG